MGSQLACEVRREINVVGQYSGKLSALKSNGHHEEDHRPSFVAPGKDEPDQTKGSSKVGCRNEQHAFVMKAIRYKLSFYELRACTLL
jgi:hypothetical protein